MFQKVLCLVLSVATLLGAFAIGSSAQPSVEGNSTTAPSLEEMKAVSGIGTYAEYISAYAIKENDNDAKEIIVFAAEGEGSDDNGEVTFGKNDSLVSNVTGWENWEGYLDGFTDPTKAGNAIYLSAQGEVNWQCTINVGEGGWYKIEFEYYSCDNEESSTSSIERKLLINGKIPFREASSLTFDKFWAYDNKTVIDEKDSLARPDLRCDGTYYEYVTDENGYYKYVVEVKSGVARNVAVYTLSQDINGNSMAPGLDVTPRWNTYACTDASGYYDDSFAFYFVQSQTVDITLEAIREPMAIKSVKLIPMDNPNKGESEVIGYDSYKEQHDSLADNSANGQIIKIEAEFPDYVSDSSVTPSNDKTSSATYPSVAKAQLYNIIGKKSYSTVGQWAAYSFSVTQDGYYKLGMRYKQDALQGMYICRALKLTGGEYGDIPSVPFAEANDVRFNYSKEWQSTYLGKYYAVEGQEELAFEAFEFYFEAGEEYTVYLECSLGSLREYIQEVENILNEVNEAYLEILQLTGSDPDPYRSYNFHQVMPGVLTLILESAERLMEIKEELEALCRTNGSHIATLETVAVTFNRAASNMGHNLAANLESMKSYLGTLGTWVSNSKTGAMVVDTIVVAPSDETDKALPETSAGFFSSLWFEFSSFIYSFFTEYDQMGLQVIPDENTTTIDVWLDKGRDQSQIWRTMVDAKQTGFTDQTGIAVTLKLVAGGTLLPSILSGKGPDIYMELDSATVINYAIRGAIVSVNGTDPNMTTAEQAVFSNYSVDDDLYKNCVKVGNTYVLSGKYDAKTNEYDMSATKTVSSNAFLSRPYEESLYDSEPGEELKAEDKIYVDAALRTLHLGIISEDEAGNEKLIEYDYGIPMTMSFSMLFYRSDALADLDVSVPKTWEEMLSILPKLQTNSMQIGISYVAALDFMIYQMGGSLWKYEDIPEYAGSRINYDDEICLDAFTYVCRWFTDHSFPVSYDAANRFRTAEMPLLVGDYISLYNQLIVFATEIDGLWGFCPLPGVETEDEDGNKVINYDSLAGVRATIMLSGCDDKLAAWKFMQWQTSADVQAEYGNQMVAIIGPSAKYEAANIKAINDLSWTSKEKEAIFDQIANMSSIVNYPGSYIFARYTKFAFLDAVNDGVDPSSALQDYIPAINIELTRKREEFNLKTGDPVK